MATASGFDAFISYSHRHDLALGPALQTGLERFVKPWYRPRTLRIFRDAANLSAGAALWSSIEDALGSSRWFILLASPESARSEWVNREVRWWLDHHGIERLLLVATASGLVWDERARDWADDAPVPPALHGAFSSEPRWVDLTEVPRHRRVPVIPAELLAEVAAPIRGVPKDTLFGDYLGKHKRVIRLAWAAIAFLLALTVSLAVVAAVAVRARQQAISERNIAISGQLISQSESLGDANPALSRLLSIEAWRLYPSSAARYAMLAAAALPGTAVLPGQRNNAVTAVAFSPSGTMLADVTQSSGDVRLWDIVTHRLLRTPFPGNTEIDAVAFSPDGRMLAGADSVDGIVRLWDIAAGRQIETLVVKRTDGTVTLAFSPDGQDLAVGYGGGWVRLWDVATGQQIGTPLKSPSYPAISVAFSPNGQTLAVADESGTVQLWDVATHQRAGNPMLQASTEPGKKVTFSPDGSLLASVGNLGSLTLWDVATGQQARPLGGRTGELNSVAFSPDGQMLATAGEDGTVRLWDVGTRQEIGNPLDGGAGSVDSVAFSPDGHTLVTGNYDGTVRLWDVTRLVGTTTFTSPDIPRSPVGGLAFSPDGKILAVGGNFNHVWLFSVASHAKVATLTVPGNPGFGGVAFSPNGRILAATSAGETFLWNTATRKPMGHTLSGPANTFMSMTFSPDGRLLAVGGGNEVQVWDVATRRQLGKPFVSTKSSDNTVSSVAFSVDSQTLAVGTFGGTVKLYIVATAQQIGEPLLVSDKPGVPVTSVVFDPRGRFLAVGGNNGSVRIWNVSYLTDVVPRLCAAARSALTRAEWAHYVNGLAYENVCP
jgi:WD40 repeat protein